NVKNKNEYNTVQTVRNQIVQNAVQNLVSRAEGNKNRNNGNQIRCYNYKGLGHWKRILKKKTKTRPKTTKPNTEWKRLKMTKSFEAESQKSKPDVNKSQPDKAEVEK
nr:hypothetical protein [Tanacetum cinerariifolium]